MSGEALDPIVRAALAGELDAGAAAATDAEVLERMRRHAQRVRDRTAAERAELEAEPPSSAYVKRGRRARRTRSSNRKRKRTLARTRKLELQATGAVPLVGKIRDVGFVQVLRRCVASMVWLRDEQPRGERWAKMNELERRRWAVIRRQTEASVLAALRELLEVATPDEMIERDAVARRSAAAG